MTAGQDPRGWASRSHWHHTRRPANAAEEAEAAAELFTPDLTAEVAIAVLERTALADELEKYARLSATPGSDYRVRRDAAIGVKDWRPDPRIGADVDAATAALAALEAPPVTDDDAHRALFAKAVVSGSRGDEATAFRRWLEDRATGHAHAVRVAVVRGRLALTGANRPARLAPPSFTAEVERAWHAHASELHRRAAQPSSTPGEPTRRVRPDPATAATPDDSSAAASADASGPALPASTQRRR